MLIKSHREADSCGILEDTGIAAEDYFQSNGWLAVRLRPSAWWFEPMWLLWRAGFVTACLTINPSTHGQELLGKKPPLLRHFMLNMIVLPRQARDKHRENSK